MREHKEDSQQEHSEDSPQGNGKQNDDYEAYQEDSPVFSDNNKKNNQNKHDNVAAKQY